MSHWKEPEADYVALATNIGATLLLWSLLIWAAIRNLRDAQRAKGLRASNVSLNDEIRTQRAEIARLGTASVARDRNAEFETSRNIANLALQNAQDEAETTKKELQEVRTDNEVLKAQLRLSRLSEEAAKQKVNEVPAPVLSTLLQPFGPIILPSTMGQASKGTHSSFNGTVTVFTFQLLLGDRRNLEFIRTRGLQLELREIREHIRKEGGDGSCGAVLRATTAGGLVYGGEKTTKTDVNCYYVPFNTVQQTNEAYSIYLYYYADNYLMFVTLHVEHINPHTGIVTIRGCEAQAGL
jgi:hypothetical protein